MQYVWNYLTAAVLQSFGEFRTNVARLDEQGLFFVAAGLLVGIVLFAIRLRMRLVYAVIELAFGTYALIAAVPIDLPGFTEDFSDDFFHGGLKVNAIQIVGAIYILIRGMDNAHRWWIDRKPARRRA